MHPGDLLHPQNLYTLLCRPALPKDTPDVMELTRHIWGGEDYVPFVWADWLADPQGLLAVAEYGGRVVGLSKLSRLSPHEWWLQGLRVHPDFQGRGIASRLHDYMLDFWQRSDGRVLRMATASFRLPVQHLCQRTGFQKVGEFSIYQTSAHRPEPGAHSNAAAGLGSGEAPVLNSRDDPASTGFRRLENSEIPAALAFIQEGPALPLSYGLVDLGWEWVAPSEYFLKMAIERGWGWWWEGGEGLVLFYEDEEGGKASFSISLLACPLEKMAACLQDASRLAGVLNSPYLGWIAPLHPGLQPVLEAAGFRRQWDASVYVYEKWKP